MYGVETFISAAVKPYLDLTWVTHICIQPVRMAWNWLRPENKCSANVDYRFLKDKDGHYRGTVSAGVNYVGKQRDYGNTNPTDTWNSSYSVARIAANYQITKHFKIKGRIENALNKTYRNLTATPRPASARTWAWEWIGDRGPR